MRSQQESHSLLRGLGQDIGELWREQANTTDAVDVLSQITIQASDRAHGDALNLKDSVDNVRHAVRDGTREIHGPANPRVGIFSFGLLDPQGFFEVLSAYKKGALKAEATLDVERLIDAKLSSKNLAAELEDERQKYLEATPLSETADQISHLIYLVEHPSNILKRPEESRQILGSLFRHVDSWDTAREFTQSVENLLALSRKAQSAPLQKRSLVQLTNSGLLNDGMQHVVKAQHPEARTEGTLVDINYSMLDLVGQGDVAIQQRETLISRIGARIQQGAAQIAQGNTLINQGNVAIQQRDTLAQQGLSRLRQGEAQIAQGNTLIKQGQMANQYFDGIFKSLVGTNEHLVDLKTLVADFSTTVAGGFEQVSNQLNSGFSATLQGLDHVRQEVALSRAVLGAEIRRLEQSLVAVGEEQVCEQKQTNTLLEQLIQMQRNSHEGEANQHFEDAVLCLQKASTRADIEDALDAFQNCIKVRHSSAVNQYGAGIASELLEKFNAALEYYRKAIDRSPESDTETPLMAAEGVVRIREKQGEFLEAIRILGVITEANPDNLIALYDRARLSALVGLSQGALQALETLIRKNDLYLLRFRVNPQFDGLPIKATHEMYKKLVSDEALTTPEVIYRVLIELIAFKDLKLAAKLYKQLLISAPQLLVAGKIWKNKKFVKLIEGFSCRQAKNWIGKSGENNYCLSILAYHEGMSAKRLADLFIAELDNDPDCWEEDGNTKVFEKMALLNRESFKAFFEFIWPKLPSHLKKWLTKNAQ